MRTPTPPLLRPVVVLYDPPSAERVAQRIRTLLLQ